MRPILRLSLVAVFLSIGSISSAHAQAAKGSAPPPAATVNGIAITSAALEHAVRLNVAQGRPDTPELRRVLRDELINREVLAQEAARRGVERSPEALARLLAARQSALIELLFEDQLATSPISDKDVKTEYDRQLAALKDSGATQQYQLRILVTATEAESRDALTRIRKGEDFDKLARERSLDASRDRGGLLDWLLPNQIVPAVSNVIVNLSKGGVSAVPIQAGAGWNVVKVEGVRPYTPPPFEEVKDSVRASLVQQSRAELLRKLRESAKIGP
jgi:peptidyl-prolyl cis-trans isomerase C